MTEMHVPTETDIERARGRAMLKAMRKMPAGQYHVTPIPLITEKDLRPSVLSRIFGALLGRR